MTWPALRGFSSAKRKLAMQRQCCFRLQLVVSVVFSGPVYWSGGGWACGEQAQFQDVFKGARVRGNGIVLGHAELICHARNSLAAVRDGGVLSQYRQFLRAGWKSRRPRSVTRPEEPWRGRPPRTPAKIRGEGRTPFVVESGPVEANASGGGHKPFSDRGCSLPAGRGSPARPTVPPAGIRRCPPARA